MLRWPNFQGKHSIHLVNGQILVIDVIRTMVSDFGVPLALITKDGKLYNWMTIISIEEVQD